MANNSNRKAIEFMVQGALPPHSTNILWMDTSVPTLPVLKIFENGAWTTVHTEQSKVDELLTKTVLEQAKVIDTLTNGINTKLDTVTEDLGKAVNSLDTVTEDLNTLQQTVAKEENATANKNELKQHIIQENRNIAGDCVIHDFEEIVLAFDKEDGYPIESNDGDISFNTDDSSEYHNSYKIGSIIKIQGLPQQELDYYAAKSVDDSEPQYEGHGLHFGEDDFIHGVTESFIVQEGHYYRITGIYDLYDKYCLEVVNHIFTYEEISPGTITDLGKQLSNKIDNQVARESTSLEIKELVLREGIILANEYAETINNITGDFSNG